MKTQPHQQKAQAAGPIFQINLERQTFKLLTPDNQAITAPYTTQNRQWIITALKSPTKLHIKISGPGKFDTQGNLKQITQPCRTRIIIPDHEPNPQPNPPRSNPMTTPTHHEKVDITGPLIQVDLERRQVKLRTKNGQTLTATFTDETAPRIMTILQDPDYYHIRVTGQAQFTPDGTIQRLTKTENIYITRPEIEIPPGTPSVGEMIDEIVAQMPPETWAGIPTDLSHRHDFYIYGVDLSEE